MMMLRRTAVRRASAGRLRRTGEGGCDGRLRVVLQLRDRRLMLLLQRCDLLLMQQLRRCECVGDLLLIHRDERVDERVGDGSMAMGRRRWVGQMVG